MMDKAKLRMMAMDKMAKEKPELMDRLAAKKSAPDEMMGEEGMVSMPVTPEEKEMILEMREKKESDESASEHASEPFEA